MSLSDKVKQLRLEKDWSQNDLARQSGLDRGYIANLEGSKSIKKPSADTFLKLARAFNIRPEELYEAAGYITESTVTYPRAETVEEILSKLRLATPVSIPVYTDYPVHAGTPMEPVEYIYRARNKPTPRGIEGYFVHGGCLEPRIASGDIIIVDREGEINNGDIVVCLVNNEVWIGRLRKIADELWLENNRDRHRLEDCQAVAPVIEVIKRLK